jgi:hypothetical protein
MAASSGLPRPRDTASSRVAMTKLSQAVACVGGQDLRAQAEATAPASCSSGMGTTETKAAVRALPMDTCPAAPKASRTNPGRASGGTASWIGPTR